MPINKRASLLEQTGVLLLIVGRWLLPQGTVSRDQFAQILLIYVGTAADIVEFSEVFGEDDINTRTGLLRGVMGVWGWSVLQFSMTIALPEEGLKEEEKEEVDDDMDNESYFRQKMNNKVAPMSYMHYKSMLREGFENESDSKARNPAEAQRAFRRHKYEITSNRLKTLRARARTDSFEKLKRIKKNSTATANGNVIAYESPVMSAKRARSSTTTSEKSLHQSPASTKSANGDARSPKLSIQSPTSGQLSSGTRKGQKKVSAWRFWQNANNSPRTPNVNNRRDSVREDNRLGIDKKDVNNCCRKYLDVFTIGLPILMQDGPFFVFRVILMANGILSDMMILLSIKNLLVVIVIVYRLLILYCHAPVEDSEDVEDASSRVRTAMNSTKKMSDRVEFREGRASIAIQAITRMQMQLSQTQEEAVTLPKASVANLFKVGTPNGVIPHSGQQTTGELEEVVVHSSSTELLSNKLPNGSVGKKKSFSMMPRSKPSITVSKPGPSRPSYSGLA